MHADAARQAGDCGGRGLRRPGRDRGRAVVRPAGEGGTIRLPRLMGMSRAMDMTLTGRGVSGEEAFTMGLANRVVEPGTALASARELAKQIASFPQRCMRGDRMS